MNRPIRGAGLRLALGVAALATAVTTGGAIAAAVAPAASAATLGGPSVTKYIHQVRCTRTTLDVSYSTRGTIREKCYEGVGSTDPHIRNVRLITTGVNSGYFAAQSCDAHEAVDFRPHEAFVFRSGPQCPVTLDVLRITRT